MKFGVGQPVRRFEDQTLITGRGRYTDDIQFAKATQAVVLRSRVAHANIRRIDAAAARSMPGVLLVLTGDDVKAEKLGDVPCQVPLTNRDGSARHDTPRPVLAIGKVRHVGQPVALVVAETLAQAQDAAEAIEIDYETLPAVTDTRAALDKDAPQLFADIPGNLVFDWDNDTSDFAATDAAFAKAAHVTTLEMINNRVVANSMEPRNAIGDWDAAAGRRGALHRHAGLAFRARSARRNRAESARKNKLRVVTPPNVGGGFGMKAFVYPEQVLVVWAASKLKRPVHWQSDRSEGFISDNQGRDHFTRAELAMDAKGKFLGLRVFLIANLGAYLSPMGAFVPTRSTDLISGLYTTPAIAINVKGVCTNTVPVCAYRGAGRPEASYLIERLVDAAAREMNMTPGQDPAHQSHSGKGHSLHVADQAHLRLRRVREDHGPRHGECRLERLLQAPQGEREARQAARHRHGDLHGALRRRIWRDRVDRVQGRPGRAGDGQSGIRHRHRHLLQAGRVGPARHRCRPASTWSTATPTARRAD